MKTRNGFVSNSSSSSFVCDVCGTAESGWDASYEDVGMVCCTEGHTFCEHHNKDVVLIAFPHPPVEQMVKELVETKTWRDDYPKELAELSKEDLEEEYTEFLHEYGATIDSQNCTVCRMDVVTDGSLLAFLILHSTFDNKKQAVVALKKEFSTLAELSNASAALEEYNKDENS